MLTVVVLYPYFPIKFVFFLYISFSVTNFNNRNMRPDNDGV